jgi:hypothetical protein
MTYHELPYLSLCHHSKYQSIKPTAGVDSQDGFFVMHVVHRL